MSFRPLLADVEGDILAKALHDRYAHLCKCRASKTPVRNCAWHWPTAHRKPLADLYYRLTERRRGRPPGQIVHLEKKAE